MASEKVSIILPVHNESERLDANISKLLAMLRKDLDDFEIIISEDGSTDGTAEIAKRLESEQVRIFHNQERKGKGAAIRSAAGYAKGDIIIFMDADLASDPTHIRELVDYIKKGAAIVIGSRYMAESRSDRAPLRYIASKGFNWLVRIWLGSTLSDHQCGFKAFRKDLVLPIINEVQDGGWFWDTELLVRAQRKGLSIAEIPIGWREISGSKFRLLEDSARMAYSLARFRIRN